MRIGNVKTMMETLGKMAEKVSESGATKIAEKNGNTLWEIVEKGKRTLQYIKADGTKGRTVVCESMSEKVTPFSEDVATFARHQNESPDLNFVVNRHLYSSDANGKVLADIYTSYGGVNKSRSYLIDLTGSNGGTFTRVVDDAYRELKSFENNGFVLTKYAQNVPDVNVKLYAKNPYGESVQGSYSKSMQKDGCDHLEIDSGNAAGDGCRLADGTLVHDDYGNSPYRVPQRLLDLEQVLREYFFPTPKKTQTIDEAKMVKEIKGAIEKTVENLKQ